MFYFWFNVDENGGGGGGGSLFLIEFLHLIGLDKAYHIVIKKYSKKCRLIIY